MKRELFLATLAALCLAACTPKQPAETQVQMPQDTQSIQSTSVEQTSANGYVPYREADHYFVRNDVKQPVPAKINSQDEFDKYFGMAAVMGKNGRPTPIDFASQFVIAVVLPETNQDIDIEDERLIDDGTNLTFEYSVERDDEINTYTQVPMELIIVSRQNERENVVLKEVPHYDD